MATPKPAIRRWWVRAGFTPIRSGLEGTPGRKVKSRWRTRVVFKSPVVRYTATRVPDAEPVTEPRDAGATRITIARVAAPPTARREATRFTTLLPLRAAATRVMVTAAFPCRESGRKVD